MYLSFYGFSKPPFDTSPQADIFFETPQHSEALASIIYGVTERRGFIAVTGPIGIGKTTILRTALRYFEKNEPDLIVVEFMSPLLSPEQLLTLLAKRVELSGDDVTIGDLEALRIRLLAWRDLGRPVVLVFDEAQSIPLPTLEFLRILSNLDGQGSPLLVVIFSAQPEFETRMSLPENAALNQRIAIRTRIAPLDRDLARDYVRFRLVAAGGTPALVMAPKAIDEIVRLAGTTPRRLNVLADNALVVGYGRERRPLRAEEVRDARPALGQETPPADGGGRGRRPILLAGAGLVVAAGIAAALAWDKIGPWQLPVGHPAPTEQIAAALPPQPPKPATQPEIAANPPSHPAALPPSPPPPEPAQPPAPISSPAPATPAAVVSTPAASTETHPAPAIVPAAPPPAAQPAPSPAPATPATPPRSAPVITETAPANYRTIKVSSGDSIWKLLEQNGFQPTPKLLKTIKQLNNLDQNTVILPGHTLRIPIPITGPTTQVQ